ncbi:MAG TPA: hypothetical protein DEF88_11305, partial [Porphyromonadaceae bacterium]|nr:hypothetical protein [Porphyromonadaceae bacterium]
GIANAQLQKGSTLVGGSIGQIDFGIGSGSKFNIGITPRIGYFIQDNIALGGKVDLGYTSQENNDTFNYGLNAFGRYYFGENEFETLLKQGRWFLEAGAGLAGHTGNEVGFNVNFGPGYAYFLSDNVAVEALLLYNTTLGKGSTNGLVLNVGFQIYFPTSTYKSAR